MLNIQHLTTSISTINSSLKISKFFILSSCFNLPVMKFESLFESLKEKNNLLNGNYLTYGLMYKVLNIILLFPAGLCYHFDENSRCLLRKTWDVISLHFTVKIEQNNKPLQKGLLAA
jgi:NADH:ubiquinone oxidoreductase subunit 3 (subunit A)